MYCRTISAIGLFIKSIEQLMIRFVKRVDSVHTLVQDIYSGLWNYLGTMLILSQLFALTFDEDTEDVIVPTSRAERRQHIQSTNLSCIVKFLEGLKYFLFT